MPHPRSAGAEKADKAKMWPFPPLKRVRARVNSDPAALMASMQRLQLQEQEASALGGDCVAAWQGRSVGRRRERRAG